MFAFAIWDMRRQELLLARDRFGMKPLYVVEEPWGIAFCSELKALIGAGLAPRELDLAAIDVFLELGYIPAPRTPLRGVTKLEPGHTLTWHAERAPVRRRYWELPRHETEAPADVEERVRAWIDDSVKAHLVADVPVAALLSGGMDSSAIVSSMALQGETPHAFTVRYHGSGAERADETQLARLLADRYGAKLTVVDVRPDIGDVLDRIIYALDEPHADESAIPMWYASERVAQEYKVVLAGTGGDELFGGYRRHMGLLLGEQLDRLPTWMRGAAGAVVRRLPEPRNGSLTVDRLKRFMRDVESESAPDRLLGYTSRLPDEQRRALWGRSEGWETSARGHFRDLHADGGAPRGLRAALHLDYRAYLPDDILALGDRISSAHSLEMRLPLVDHLLVEQVYPLPDRTKVGFGTAKRLLRRALRPRLPDAHFRAPKRGFVGPTASWMRNELRDMLIDELAPDRMQRLGFFAPDVVSGLVDDHLSHRQNREGILWALLCFSLWYRQNVEQEAAVDAFVG
jgi:asparagine synthase (glutamine-hydrolysing)